MYHQVQSLKGVPPTTLYSGLGSILHEALWPGERNGGPFSWSLTWKENRCIKSGDNWYTCLIPAYHGLCTIIIIYACTWLIWNWSKQLLGCCCLLIDYHTTLLTLHTFRFSSFLVFVHIRVNTKWIRTFHPKLWVERYPPPIVCSGYSSSKTILASDNDLVGWCILSISSLLLFSFIHSWGGGCILFCFLKCCRSHNRTFVLLVIASCYCCGLSFWVLTNCFTLFDWTITK